MELKRLFKALRHRWRVVVMLSLIGLVSAVGFTNLANQNVTNLYEALIPIRFDPDEGETVEELAGEVEDARGLAVLAAGDLLAKYPNASIFADRGSGRLIFLAQGDSTDQALERATELVEAYFETDPVVGGDVNEQLAEYARQATDLEAQIDALQPSLSSSQQDLVARHDLLDQQIAAVRARIVSLTVADAAASEEVRSANEVERARLESIRDELQAEKSALAPRPSAELSAADKLRRDALQRGRNLLSLDYERLALRTLGVASGGRLEPATLGDLSPEPASPLTNGLIGLVGGLGLAILAVMFVTRARGEFWLPEDLPVPVLAEVPSRKPSTAPGPPWYDSSQGGRRKESIQALRNALEGAVDSHSAALAIVADKVDSATSHALAIDLSTAFASAGRSVLIVDADYAEPATTSEYNVGEPTLESILSLPAGSPDLLTESVDGVLSRAVNIRPDLAVVPAGVAPRSPADAVAGSQFRSFLEVASRRFDLVIIVAGSSRSPAAQVVSQRVGRAFIAALPGTSTSSGVGSLVADLVQQRVDVLGVVAIHGHERRLPRPAVATPSLLRRDSGQTLSASSTDRLSRYPFPGSRTSGMVSGGTIRELADELATAELLIEDSSHAGGEDSDALGPEVLDAISRSDNGRAYLPVAHYVVARVEDMMNAVEGQASISSRTLDVVLRYGFVPFESVDGHASIGDHLVHELIDELGREAGERIAQEFARVLEGQDEDSTKVLNEWIAKEFFARHIERTYGEPEVWHLTSEKGAVQILVSSRRLDQKSIEQINVDIVRRTLDGYQRELKAARESADYAAIDTIEDRLREVHLFEISLGLLQVGSSDDAKIVYPWRRSDQQPRGWNPIWAEGIEANIAPLQRLGLLAAPVLSEEQLTPGQTTT